MTGIVLVVIGIVFLTVGIFSSIKYNFLKKDYLLKFKKEDKTENFYFNSEYFELR